MTRRPGCPAILAALALTLVWSAAAPLTWVWETPRDPENALPSVRLVLAWERPAAPAPKIPATTKTVPSPNEVPQPASQAGVSVHSPEGLPQGHALLACAWESGWTSVTPGPAHGFAAETPPERPGLGSTAPCPGTVRSAPRLAAQLPGPLCSVARGPPPSYL